MLGTSPVPGVAQDHEGAKVLQQPEAHPRNLTLRRTHSFHIGPRTAMVLTFNHYSPQVGYGLVA